MAAPAKVILNGLRPTLGPLKLRRSVSGPDEADFTAHDCSAIDTYSPGDTVPGYGNLRIVETRPEVIPGSLFNITCRARGLISGSSRVISRRITTTADGWDEISERRMEATSQAVPSFGDRHPSHTNMFFMHGGLEESLDLGTGLSQWVQRDRTYRGMAAAVTKLVSRKITANECIVTQDSVKVPLPGGWTNFRKGQISMPRIVVADTVLTTFSPPTAGIPGNSTPLDPPSVQVFTISGSGLTNNWPNQWKLASIDNQELFLGAGVNLQTLVYEYVWPQQF